MRVEKEKRMNATRAHPSLERAAVDGGDARGRGLGLEPDRPARRGGTDIEGAYSTGKFDYHK